MLVSAIASKLLELVKMLCENFEAELKETFRFCEGLQVPNIEKQAKISWQRVTQEPSFIVESDYYLLDSMAFLTHYSLSELHYLLGFLNSKAIFYYFKHIGHLYSDKGFLLSNQYVERFPIPKTADIDKQIHQEILACVKEILEINNACHSERALAAEESHNPPPNPLRKGGGRVECETLAKGGGNACHSEPALNMTICHSEPALAGEVSHDAKPKRDVSTSPQHDKITQLESRLDSLIYQAYNLTQNEIALIESSFESAGGGAEIIENLYCLLESFVRDSRAYMGKIIYPVIAKEMTAHLDMQGFFTNDKCFILTLNRYNENILFYLIALFNSKIMFWYFQQIGATLGANGYEMRKIFIEKLPIPKITESNQHLADRIVALVDAILAIKTNCHSEHSKKSLQNNRDVSLSMKAQHDKQDSVCHSEPALAGEESLWAKKQRASQRDVSGIRPQHDKIPDTSNLEFEIDSLVYQLYGMSDEEIKLVDSKKI